MPLRSPQRAGPAPLSHSFKPARSRPRLPPVAPGLRIGLFGGSFNPPHEGHRLVTLTALRRLKLDRVWWLVTPGNPLKDNQDLPPLEQRMTAARNLMRHPKVKMTGFEREIGTRFTYDTIRYLTARLPQVRFVWIMGADNLAGFHNWQRWQEIARLVPIAVIDRPGATLRAASSRAARRFQRARIEEGDAVLLASLRPPAWIFLHGRRSAQSSTQLRTKYVTLPSSSRA